MHLESPDQNCNLCPRLVNFRLENRKLHPTFHNGPVDSFGPLNARLLIVGLAPGLKGANRTARPFTGDFAGDLLYPTLIKFGFAAGSYHAKKDDGLRLKNCRISNAVRCVPPKNKPLSAEINTCQQFLWDEVQAMPKLKIILALGLIAHRSIVHAFGYKQVSFNFGHSNEHKMQNSPLLIDSYHCSRYNTSTGRLTTYMFESIFHKIRNLI